MACSAASASSSKETAFPTIEASVITVEELVEGGPRALAKIKDALGRDGPGIIALRGVPGLAEARSNLLPLADHLANLPPDELARLEDPESFFSVGWSLGKETLEGGIPDFNKGSFYANPVYDALDVTPEELRLHPSYTRPNVWPESIPALRPALRTMGALIVDHGRLLARACDKLVCQELGKASVGTSSIEAAIADSVGAKSRLLHYYPPRPDQTAAPDSSGSEADKMGSWCGWHLDHGSLTGLTAAMFTDTQGGEVGNPDSARCGLYVRSRKGSVFRVKYGPDCLAYQMGEASQIMSGGVLEATPHCVVGADGPDAAGVARNTFAIFMQPRWDLVMEEAAPCPEIASAKGFEHGMTFGDFTNVRLAQYY